MIDIHSHLLPFIDDGSDTIEQSISMLYQAVENGITDIICTPHYRTPHLSSYNEVKKSFDDFCRLVKEKQIPVNLYLGREIYVERDFKHRIDSDNYLMNDSKYILIEFSSSNCNSIAEIVYELVIKKYIPIVAHIERYNKVTVDDALEIVDVGGLIQVNADSIVGNTRRYYYKFIKKLLKNKLVSFVASDIHSNRENVMKKAYEYVAKKFDKAYADNIFNNNAKKIIEN